ncbi:hypothetical protein GOEFS_015_00570 [Gordonia effusa NBRC 100432]|uniref:VOC domain-containing protein n=1 Tax=Gordonia effusa NBRC 100432 TaxID=1077974 RepID=H0QVI3_9ACTN|nr:VOC family protein [Gordonia effusa]GAB16860.1 hypothetical protein GOEFS_015_00570 [Gordonia effusa NBRC 100432]
MMSTNEKYDLRGVNHLALVCADMKRTIDFYSGVLGMPLIKTIELPNDMGQHFFFDCGNGNTIAFFWLADAPDGVPGVSAPAGLPDEGELNSATGSMNHVAFAVPPEKFDEYYAKFKEEGIKVSHVLNHDDSPMGISRDPHEGTFVRSFYFQDPDGALLEFACWTKTFTEADVVHEPRTAADRKVSVAR